MSARKPLLVGVGAALAVLALWYIALWKPQTANLEQAHDDLMNAEQQRSTLSMKLRKLERLKANEPVLRSQLAALTAAVPDSPALSETLLTLNDVANRTGMGYLSVSQSEPAGSGGLPTMGITIQGDGGYSNVLAFLDALATMPRLMVVDSVTLAPQGAEVGGAKLSVNLAGRMFVNPAGAARAAATPATAAPQA